MTRIAPTTDNADLRAIVEAAEKATRAVRKCHLCDSTEHHECGFCSRCKEHATATDTCETCKGSGEVSWNYGEGDQTGPCGDCDGDGHIGEPLTDCCGAPLWAYDDNPMEDE